MRPLKALLEAVRDVRQAEELARHAFAGLTPAQRASLQAQGRSVYTGKVRDVVDRGGGELSIVHSDRLTAFDRMIAMVPYKGVILNAISAYWLKEAQKVVPTHLLGSPHERVLRVKRTEPVRIEVVVRGYLAGAMLRAYEQGERHYCGARLPEGLGSFGKLPEAIITPTTKAAAFEHDENATPAELIARGVCSEADWRRISSMALELFAYGQEVFAKRGWILVDTKYEFGRDAKGELIVIDEVHTPDSSRLWEAATYGERLARSEPPVMLDKENVRRWLLAQGFSGHGEVPTVPADVLVDLALVYLRVAEALLGHPLSSRGPEPELDLAVV
jgi:phosphoribosylaminoimidazole-succinocarboxamide synthase